MLSVALPSECPSSSCWLHLYIRWVISSSDLQMLNLSMWPLLLLTLRKCFGTLLSLHPSKHYAEHFLLWNRQLPLILWPLSRQPKYLFAEVPRAVVSHHIHPLLYVLFNSVLLTANTCCTNIWSLCLTKYQDLIA